jgi:hypothetical protein
MLEACLRLGVAAEGGGLMVARSHRGLEPPELLLGGSQVCRAREDVVPQ